MNLAHKIPTHCYVKGSMKLAIFLIFLVTANGFYRHHAFCSSSNLGQKADFSLRMASTASNPEDESKLTALATAANEARGLAMDAVAAAHSGYMSIPLGNAEIGAALWGDQMIFNPADPNWINRDRFVLSPGQGSTFLYSWLHLAGYDVSLEDLSQHRQKNSKTPGFPEVRMSRSRNNTPGVECTSGPLGQGVGVAVGMAASAKLAAATYNTDTHQIFNHHVFCLAGNGCLQEGISYEACAFAAHEGLENLILLYDDNDITLDKMAEYTQSEDVLQRFQAYGWDVFEIEDGHNIEAVVETIAMAKSMKTNGNPKFILCKNIAGKGMLETEGTNASYAEAGVPYVDRAKLNLGLPQEREVKVKKPRGILEVRTFISGTTMPSSSQQNMPRMKKWYVSEGTRKLFSDRLVQNHASYKHWQETFAAWKEENPLLAKQLGDALADTTILSPQGIVAKIPPMGTTCAESTHVSGGKAIKHISKLVPHYVTGSSDLFSLTQNYIEEDGRNFGTGPDKSHPSNNLYFGLRKHAMGAIMNGFAFHGLFQISGATLLAFADYMRPAIRIGCLSELDRVSYIFTHDSIGVGQDGPIHQQVGTLSGLRLIPNLDVFRPADAEETVAAMVSSVTRKGGPTALIFSQDPIAQNNHMDAMVRREGALKGGYVAREETSNLDLIILASGSEVPLALEIAQELPGARVVSMPCMELFERQSASYREETLPPSCMKRVAIEASVSGLWYKYANKVLGVDKFGFSSPGDIVMRESGISVENIKAEIESMGC